MNEVDFWIKGFWDYFTPLIKSGYPAYFAVDSELLGEIASRVHGYHVSSNDARSMFNTVCNKFFVPGRLLSLKNQCFKKTDSGFSAVILICMQQVSVVEMMADRRCYSDESYFPVYRKALGQSDALQVSPLKSGTFQSLWNHFRREILSFDGANDRTITFMEGYGAYKNKAYPLSQALLTLSELITLLKRKEEENFNGSNDVELRRFILANRYALSKRSRSIVGNHNQQPSVVRQFLYFLKSPISINDIGTEINIVDDKTMDGRFVLYADSFDIFSDEYIFKYRMSMQEQIIGKELIDIFNSIKSVSRVLTLIDNGKYFEELVMQYEFQEADSFVLVYESEKQAGLEATFAQVYPEKDYLANMLVLQVRNMHNFNFLHCKYWVPGAKTLVAKRGMLSIKNEASVSSPKLCGGVPINKRTNTYLSNYPPTSLGGQGCHFTANSLIKINGIETMLCELSIKLESSEKFTSHQIEIEGKCILIRLECEVEHTDNYRIGFAIASSAKCISPLTTDLTDEKMFLRGMNLIDNVEEARENYDIILPHGSFNLIEAALLLQQKACWHTIGPQEVESAIAMLPKNLPPQVYRLLVRKMRMQKKVPVFLMKRFVKFIARS